MIPRFLAPFQPKTGNLPDVADLIISSMSVAKISSHDDIVFHTDNGNKRGGKLHPGMYGGCIILPWPITLTAITERPW